MREIARLLVRRGAPGDLTARTEAVIEREEKRAWERIAAYRERLRGKKVLLITGGVKSWSVVAALQEGGMEIVGTSVKKSTKEDKEKIKEIMGQDAHMIEDMAPREMYKLLKDARADIMLSGGRSQFVALKAKMPWLDINQERHYAYAGYEGMIDLVREIDKALSNPVWRQVRTPAPWDEASWEEQADKENAEEAAALAANPEAAREAERRKLICECNSVRCGRHRGCDPRGRPENSRGGDGANPRVRRLWLLCPERRRDPRTDRTRRFPQMRPALPSLPFRRREGGMAKVEISKKACTVNPLKMSQPIGGALAFMGVNGCMPLLHGSQGCTSLGLVLFVRHFREAIPMQTTAMSEVATVLGGYENVEQAVITIANRAKPAMIGICSTGVTEIKGDDVDGFITLIRQNRPELNHLPLVYCSTPDFKGAFQDGWAGAVTRMVEVLVETPAANATREANRINILPGCHLTPGDLEELRDIVEAFGLAPSFLPDLSGSLDGHIPETFTPTTIGGISVEERSRAWDARPGPSPSASRCAPQLLRWRKRPGAVQAVRPAYGPRAQRRFHCVSSENQRKACAE